MYYSNTDNPQTATISDISDLLVVYVLPQYRQPNTDTINDISDLLVVYVHPPMQTN